MSYLGDVHRARSFEAAGGVARQPVTTTPVLASIGPAVPPQATATATVKSKIDRTAIFAARRASLSKLGDATPGEDGGSEPGAPVEGKARFASLARDVFARRKAGV
ncbi:MAG: hypothetical protein ACK43M_22415 [Allorhizobium sp.]